MSLTQMLDNARVQNQTGEWRPVDAMAVCDVPGLMIHPHPHTHGVWLVSHVASGASVGPEFPSVHRAVQFVVAAGAHADWTQPYRALKADTTLAAWVRHYKARSIHRVARDREAVTRSA